MGCALVYLGLVVVLPLAAVLARSLELSPHRFAAVVLSPRVLASYRLSFGMALGASLIDLGFGSLLAWVLVRYPFPGRRVVDALVDLPFALPTAVAGVALTAVYAPQSWLGDLLSRCGVQIDFKPTGILVALMFIGLPFIVRTLQPVLQELELELEEAAASLGADRRQTWCHVVLPQILPAMLTGFALAFARGIGEYGSVIFIAGNIPMVSEITPLMIVTHLDEYDYAGATAIAAVMLGTSFALLLAINALQAWSAHRTGRRQ